MKYENGQYIREYKDLEDKEVNALSIGTQVDMKLDQINDWIQSSFEGINSLSNEAKNELDQYGSIDYLEDIPRIINEIRTLIKA